MIEGVAAIAADGLAVSGAGVQHQQRAGRSVPREDLDHAPLIVVVEVKKAVPGEDAGERRRKAQRAHIRADPCLTGKPLSAQGDERLRRVDARHRKAVGHEVCGHRVSAAAAQVEDRRMSREVRGEALVPGPVVPAAGAPIGVPRQAMTLVQRNDLVR